MYKMGRAPRVLLGSIGTVVIDSFDRPPQPCDNCVTLCDDVLAKKSSISVGSGHQRMSALLDSFPTATACMRDDYANGLPSPTLSDSASSASSYQGGHATHGTGLSASYLSELRKATPPAHLTITVKQPNEQHAGGSRFNLSPTSTVATRLSGARTPQLDFGDTESDLSVPENSYDILGGGALYALVGARMWLPADRLRTLVDRKGKGRALPPPPAMDDHHRDHDDDHDDRAVSGEHGIDVDEDDLPRELQDQLSVFGEEMWVWNRSSQTRMTRSRIRYDGDVRLFQAVVKAPKRTLSSLRGTPVFGAEYLHIAPPASPEDVCELLEELRRYNAEVASRTNGHAGGADSEEAWWPKIVFEPTPPSCHPEQRPWLEQCLPGLAVLSPNHEELLCLFGEPSVPIGDPAFQSTLERIIRHLLDLGIGPSGDGTVIVRCGKAGSCVGTRLRGLRWYPAGFTSEEEFRVKDVTGAGNAFLGGLVAGLSITGDDPYEAALYATMSSSFTIEQFGLPELQRLPDGTEEWNGELPRERLERYRARLRDLDGAQAIASL